MIHAMAPGLPRDFCVYQIERSQQSNSFYDFEWRYMKVYKFTYR